MSTNLLLLSNSVCHARPAFEHAADEIQSFFRGVKTVLFVPFALHDRAGYARHTGRRFADLGFRLESLHTATDPLRAVLDAEAIFVGGGNTFRLLDALYRLELLEAVRARIGAGIPYMGSSAGTNVACTSIKTTNDMPIVLPASLDALGLVPFNINAHYIDPASGSTHMGETRETRIREFHEMNDPAVVGLREGAWLRRRGPSLEVGGATGARLFEKGQEPREVAPGDRLDELLQA